MAIQNKRVALVCAGVCNVLTAAAAQAQDVSFEAARNFRAEGTLVSVAVGDFNGDCLQDLAVATRDFQTVSVLLGSGDGTFQDWRSCGGGSGRLQFDGLPDLAVAN